MSKWDKFNFRNDDFIILEKEEKQENRGAGYKTVSVVNHVWSPQEYTNCITCAGFFNNLGGCFRVYQNYTIAGYLPTKTINISPGRDNKNVSSFIFIDKKMMLECAGYREKEVLNNTFSFKEFDTISRNAIEFIARVNNEVKTAVFDFKYNTWVG